MGAEIQNGAVLVARAILNSSLWTMRAEDKVVAITCIAIASWKDGKWFDGITEIPILRGQFVRSWAGLSNDSGETIQTVRTSVQHLEKVGFLTRKPTGRYHVFTIPKYSHYQDLTKYSDRIAAESNRIPNSPLTGTQQDANRELTTYKKGIREEGKNGSTQSSHNGSVESHIVSAWNRGPGFPISHPAGQKLIKAFIASGVSAQTCEEAVSNQPACEGKKLWEVLEPLRPVNGEAVPSIEQILNNWAKKEASK